MIRETLYPRPEREYEELVLPYATQQDTKALEGQNAMFFEDKKGRVSRFTLGMPIRNLGVKMSISRYCQTTQENMLFLARIDLTMPYVVG